MPNRGATDLPEAGTPPVGRVGDLAVWLGVSTDQVAAITTKLEPWGHHADGEPVWRLREVQRRLGRPGRRSRRRVPWAGRFVGPRGDDGR
jgi:hypothetical protein